MKYCLFVVCAIVAVFYVPGVFAYDLNTMVDDALQQLPSTIDKVGGIKTIAITTFEYGKDIDIKNVEEKVSRKIAKTGKFTVVDRKALDVLLKEQTLSLTGVTEVGEMKKVGKLLSVDAFLFGKVTTSVDEVIVDLELKDVSTGGLIWAEEFRGEDPSKSSLGVGIRIGTYSADSQLYVSSAGDKGWFNLQEKSKAMQIAFLFHFVQRMQFSKNFSFGVDAIFSRGDWSITRFDDSIFNSTYTLLAVQKVNDYNLTLIPLIRMGIDPIVLYGGAGLSANYVELTGTYRLKKTDGSFDTGEISYHNWPLNPGNFAYKFGMEVKFTKQYSMFFESYYLPSMTMKFDDVDTKIAPEYTVKSGTYYGFGAKYYFFNF
ncbi:MAG: CsgG/HfaB family protein [Candidatus Firestonebacteria bacterium]